MCVTANTWWSFDSNIDHSDTSNTSSDLWNRCRMFPVYPFFNKLTKSHKCVIRSKLNPFCKPHNWAESSEFVSSSIPSWQILTAHAQPFRGDRDLAFRLKVPLDSLLVWASSGSSGETVRMRRLAWTFAARIGDKYQIRLARPNW